jgi:hypothetical protein
MVLCTSFEVEVPLPMAWCVAADVDIGFAPGPNNGLLKAANDYVINPELA